MDKWENKNLQFKTMPSFGVWSRVSEEDLERLGDCRMINGKYSR